MRPAITSLPIWIAIVVTTWGPQAAPMFASWQPEILAERESVVTVACISTAGTTAEPWEVRSNPISQTLAKIEQAAAICLNQARASGHRELPHTLACPLFASPALLRLADDLSHVRLLI